MHTARQAARQRRQRQRRIWATAVTVTAVAGLVCLVTTLLPTHGTRAAAGRAAGAGTEAAAATRPGATLPAPTGSAPPATPSPTAATATPTAPATSAAAQPSASATPQAAPPPAPSAGRIKPGATYQGVATAYAAGDGNGACLFGPTDDVMTAAMNTTDYETSRACGAYVRVHAASGASITVRITNECPLPCAPGQLDLSQQAFAKLAELKVGRIPITWTLLSPADPGTIALRYKTGSSVYWCALQVLHHRNPVARLEVRTAAGWRRLPRTGYNHFLSADGGGCGGAVRITDIYGEQLTVEGAAILPDVAQPTRLQFAPH
ncbi:expansin EXLX1 family cellulose-binding protein [Streptomyces sp. NPDC006529]|uniref:expansin EXLX1 family cellulose-binding protein n=1 Tax=Streptomyces sp. NPDC006529 TaxID=3157177 RepID=UPI0033A7E165